MQKNTLIIAKCKAKTRIQTCHKNLTNAKQMKWWAKGSQSKSTDVKSTEVCQCKKVSSQMANPSRISAKENEKQLKKKREEKRREKKKG